MKNTSNCYNKHLDLSKRIKIEKGIEEKRNFSYIANDINKSATYDKSMWFHIT